MSPIPPQSTLATIAAMLDAVPDPRIVITPDYTIRHANPAYRAAYGDDAVGRACFAVSHGYARPCDEEGESCPLKATLESGQPERVLHIHRSRHGDEHVDVELSPMSDVSGYPLLFVEKMKPLALASSQAVPDRMVGRSAAFRRMLLLAQRAAPSAVAVLLQGESGTGKELVARALHNLSRRAKAPMISVNCAAIPETLIESELFGHEKGAFTGASAGRAGLVEAADGGTLFLDEIGELPLEAQARLLRVLQEGEIRRVGSVQSQKVDVRLIAATHRDLKTLAKTGQFREDLYYRLHVIALKLPPLRERGADVVEIAQSFLTRQSERMGRDNMRFAHDAEQAIRHYPWPGNVRELENAIERSVILCEGSDISAELLGIDIELDDLEDGDFTEQSLQQGSSGNHEPTEDLSLEDYFQHFVLEHQDHMTETELARKLGISRKCLWERRQRLGIPRRKSGAATGS